MHSNIVATEDNNQSHRMVKSFLEQSPPATTGNLSPATLFDHSTGDHNLSTANIIWSPPFWNHEPGKGPVQHITHRSLPWGVQLHGAICSYIIFWNEWREMHLILQCRWYPIALWHHQEQTWALFSPFPLETTTHTHALCCYLLFYIQYAESRSSPPDWESPCVVVHLSVPHASETWIYTQFDIQIETCKQLSMQPYCRPKLVHCKLIVPFFAATHQHQSHWFTVNPTVCRLLCPGSPHGWISTWNKVHMIIHIDHPTGDHNLSTMNTFKIFSCCTQCAFGNKMLHMIFTLCWSMPGSKSDIWKERKWPSTCQMFTTIVKWRTWKGTGTIQMTTTEVPPDTTRGF